MSHRPFTLVLAGGGARGYLRIEEADVVVRPVFDRFIDVLDFRARRHCVAAGWSAMRACRDEIAAAVAT